MKRVAIDLRSLCYDFFLVINKYYLKYTNSMIYEFYPFYQFRETFSQKSINVLWFVIIRVFMINS